MAGTNNNCAHYKGRVEWEPNKKFGPDTCGARYKMDHINYDEQTDTSTVYFKPYVPAS